MKSQTMLLRLSHHAHAKPPTKNCSNLPTASIAPKPASNFPQRNTAVNFDVRNEVIAMAKRGIAPPEIARSCGVTEGEVEIVLGIIRLQRRSDTDMRERLDQKTGD